MRSSAASDVYKRQGIFVFNPNPSNELFATVFILLYFTSLWIALKHILNLEFEIMQNIFLDTLDNQLSMLKTDAYFF